MFDILSQNDCANFQPKTIVTNRFISHCRKREHFAWLWTSFSALNFNATAVLSYSWPDGSEPVHKVLGLSFIRAFYGQFMPESGYKIRMSPANDVLIAINTNRSAIVIKGNISKCSANESQAKRHCTFNFWPHICASGTEAELVDWL